MPTHDRTKPYITNWPALHTPGITWIEPSGKVVIEGFTTERTSCREHCQLAMAWGMQKLSEALMENMTADRPKLSLTD